MFGGKTSIRGATSGTASSVAFTPLQVSFLDLHEYLLGECRALRGERERAHVQCTYCMKML